MKFSIAIFFLFTFLSINAQNNFIVENNYLTWSKDFTNNLTQEELQNILQKNPALRQLSETFKGPIGNFNKNCNQTGTAIFMRYSISAYAQITPIENGYNVRIDAIVFKNTNTVIEVQSIAAEDYLLTSHNTQLRQNKQAKRDLNCLNETFTHLFTFQ